MPSLLHMLENVRFVKIIGDEKVNIEAIISAISEVPTKNSLFIATRSSVTWLCDNHRYIEDAILGGSCAIVCEDLPEDLNSKVTYVKVEDSREAIGLIAVNFYDNPSHKLKLIAVTGTCGKTSTVQILYQLFTRLRYRVGVLSTIGIKVLDETFPTLFTTPFPIEVNKYLSMMVDEGCQYCFMEATSIGIVLKRMLGLKLSGVIFTNLSHDHLDFHGTFDNYFLAKKQLFDQLPQDAFALYNADDKYGTSMVEDTEAAISSFALNNPATFTAKIVSSTFSGLEVAIDDQGPMRFQLLGKFNAYNILGAYSCARLLGIEMDALPQELPLTKAIRGRFQVIHSSKLDFDVIVDFAHTPEAVKCILNEVSSIKREDGRIISVIGCGGNRDKEKRPMIARLAYEGSDALILTSDNPRFEEPENIIDEMMKGLDANQRANTIRIVEREGALRMACMTARKCDVVVVMGRGHETHMVIKEATIEFDDVKKVQNILKTITEQE
ncbi:murE (predicted) [Pycnogonum litorale]